MKGKLALALILIFAFLPTAMFAQSRVSPGELPGWIVSTTFAWADNGNVLGTISFAADGRGKASWSGETHYWKVEPNGDLLVSAMGTQYVTRFVYDGSTGSFLGARDASSKVQDGVQATLRPAAPLNGFQPKTSAGLLERLRSWIPSARFIWMDNGNALGIIVFAMDGTGQASWSGETHYWKVEPNGDLLVSAMGNTYVTRFILNFSAGGFNGARDASSQVQDGVLSVLKAGG